MSYFRLTTSSESGNSFVLFFVVLAAFHGRYKAKMFFLSVLLTGEQVNSSVLYSQWHCRHWLPQSWPKKFTQRVFFLLRLSRFSWFLCCDFESPKFWCVCVFFTLIFINILDFAVNCIQFYLIYWSIKCYIMPTYPIFRNILIIFTICHCNKYL